MAEKDKMGVSMPGIIETALNQRDGGLGMTHFKEYSAGGGPEMPSGEPGGPPGVEQAGTKKKFKPSDG
jgi:hypothetical protein